MRQNRIVAGVLAGAFVTVVAWAARQFGGVEIPPEVQGALTVIFTAAVQMAVKERR